MIVYYDYLFTKHKLEKWLEILKTNDRRFETQYLSKRT